MDRLRKVKIHSVVDVGTLIMAGGKEVGRVIDSDATGSTCILNSEDLYRLLKSGNAVINLEVKV